MSNPTEEPLLSVLKRVRIDDLSSDASDDTPSDVEEEEAEEELALF